MLSYLYVYYALNKPYRSNLGKHYDVLDLFTL